MIKVLKCSICGIELKDRIHEFPHMACGECKKKRILACSKERYIRINEMKECPGCKKMFKPLLIKGVQLNFCYTCVKSVRLKRTD